MGESLFQAFVGRAILGGFTIGRLEITGDSLIDAIGRDALAKTSIIGRRFEILIRTPLSDEEFSITLYHEILEAMTVASERPPSSVTMFNEADFERAARQAYAELGPVSPQNLDRMLQSYGFGEE
jgi:hypothetical protein